MPHYKIGKIGAQHRRKEMDSGGKKMDWKVYGYGDTIHLTQEQFDSGKYNNLSLTQGGGVRPAPAQTQDGRSVTETGDATVSTDDKGHITDDVVKMTDDEQVQRIDSMLSALEASSGAADFNALRGRIAETDALSEYPAKKEELIAALKLRRDELSTKTE